MTINVNITHISNKRKYDFIRGMRLIINMTFYQKYVSCIGTTRNLRPYALQLYKKINPR